MTRWRGLITLLLLPWAVTSWAHADHQADWRPILDPVPAGLTGVQVTLSQTLAPQLLLRHTGTTPLEVLAEDGQPFLRISARGTEANVRHAAWFDTYLPGGLPQRQPEPGEGPLWRWVSGQPTWGWFDRRLAPEAPSAQTRWTLSVRRAGKTYALSGRFVPALTGGFWQARWRSTPQLPDGVTIQLIPGQPFGVMVSTRGPRVEVRDRADQPFLEVTPQAVRAHTGSALWRETTTQIGLLEAATGRSGWQTIAGGGRTTWIEPRTVPDRPELTQARHRWSLTLKINDQVIPLQGESTWVKRRRLAAE